MNMTRRQVLKSLALGSGVVLSSASVMSVLNFAHAATKDGSFKLHFLSQEQANMIELMSHIILPKSESLPGAEDVPFISFIDALYAKLMSADEQNKFLKGLSIAQNTFSKTYARPFLQASAEQQRSFVHSVYNLPADESAGVLALIENDTAPSGFDEQYHLYYFLFNLRALTLEAYFQSELVGEQVLAYLPIPGVWDADMDVDESTRAWSI